jgi:hypothetical protein
MVRRRWYSTHINVRRTGSTIFQLKGEEVVFGESGTEEGADRWWWNGSFSFLGVVPPKQVVSFASTVGQFLERECHSSLQVEKTTQLVLDSNTNTRGDPLYFCIEDIWWRLERISMKDYCLMLS